MSRYAEGIAPVPAPCSHLYVEPDGPDIRRYGLGAFSLKYAAAGLPPFPLVRGGKAPAIPSPHPKGDPARGRCRGECGQLGHGVWDATTDPAVITGPDFWGESPSRNIGISTERLLVFDIDTKGGQDGFASWRAFLEDEDLWLPEVPYQDTPSRGRHLILALPDGETVPGRNGFLPGVDLKSSGGYIVAWPSAIRRREGTSPETGKHGGKFYYDPYQLRSCPCRPPLTPPELIEAVRRRLDEAPASGGHGGGGGGKTSWTNPDIPALIAGGIPDGVTQRPVLRDVVWKLVQRGCADAEIRGVWDQIVGKTALTKPGEPWEGWHFRRELDSARAKPPRGGLPASMAGGVLSLVSAGSGLCHGTDGVVHDKRSDQPERPAPVKTQAQLRAKVKAETKHFSPLSRDNDNCPAGWREVYAKMADLAAANATTWSMGPAAGFWEQCARQAGCVSEAARKPADGFVFHPDQPEARGWGVHIRWSLKGGECGVPLLEQLKDGWLRLLGDTEHAREEWVCGICVGRNGFSAVHNGKNCPAVEPGSCPVTGDKLPLGELLPAIRKVLGGITHYWVAALVNHPEFRRAFGLESCRYATVAMVAQHTKRLIDAGQMDRPVDAELFRRGRRWLIAVPAFYTVSGTYAPQLLERIRALAGRILPDLVYARSLAPAPAPQEPPAAVPRGLPKAALAAGRTHQ